MRKIIAREIPDEIDQLHQHPLLHNIYAARGLTSPTEIDYDFKHLLSYKLLKNIEPAVECLAQALKEQQHILIVGDFDADGATSTVLAISALKSFGLENVSYLIPNRFEYGYGLTPEIVAVAAERNPDLIVTVDNGIASVDGVAAANALGIKVLVTDHHLPGDILPDACAIVNPSQNDDQFPSKNLAGVGVIFYLMLALRAHLRESGWFVSEKNIKRLPRGLPRGQGNGGIAKGGEAQLSPLGQARGYTPGAVKKLIPEPNMGKFLDLVALGTIADSVILDHNNRILVSQGLDRIRSGKSCLGIKALFALAKRKYEKASVYDFGFVVAPRINAAGRLDDMSVGVECLLTEDPVRARAIAKELDVMNNERRGIAEDMQRQAVRILDGIQLEKELPSGLCIFEESWHQGVLGILASRLKDKLHRPVIVFTAVNDNEIKGSARSVNNVHIREILNNIAVKAPGLIARFGGHAMAAGLSMPRENYETFAQAFDQEVYNCLAREDLAGVIYTDGELPAEYFDIEVAELLNSAGPWGAGFSEPLFHGDFIIGGQNIVGQKHLKLVLQHLDTKQEVNGICFNIDPAVWPNSRCSKAKIVYRLAINEYNGRRSLQLIISEITNYE